ncbi:MAG: tol-pal system-associated acyl-CoA thioesterase [Chakrabartia sp.]
MSRTDNDLPTAGRLVGREHRFPIRVYFEDTDFSGVVYHANYLRFMERARSDMLRVAGIDQRAAFASAEGVYAVADLSIHYRRPAHFDDALLVVSTVEQLRAAACIIEQRIWRGEDLIAEARVTAAFITPEGRPRRQPAHWVETFTRLLPDH